jgi:ABC-type amino acid transport substrate-binding protein
MLQLIIARIAAFAAFIVATGPLAAQTLDKVKQRGVLVVGTKADYKPFGFRDTSGAIVGFEPDLARDVATRLGVRLELEPVVSSNRMQFLQQGKIDLMLATMNVTQERRQTVGIIDPSYYAQNLGAAQGPKNLRHPGRLVQQGRGREIRRRHCCVPGTDRGRDRPAARQLRRVGV